MQHERDIALAAIREAGELTLEYFENGSMAVSAKPDNTPVTEADKGAERIIRKHLNEHFPADAVLGEEWGDATGVSGRRWIIDPIDGTRSFIRGVPLYGVMLGLEVAGKMELGVINFPALGEIYFGSAEFGATRNDSPISTSTVSAIEEALYLFSDARHPLELAARHPVDRWLDQAGLLRTWGDCYGHMLVASGRGEIMVDPLMSPWDCAAVIPIVQAAGGSCFDYEGNTRIDGKGLISCNSPLGEKLLQEIQSR